MMSAVDESVGEKLRHAKQLCVLLGSMRAIFGLSNLLIYHNYILIRIEDFFQTLKTSVLV